MRVKTSSRMMCSTVSFLSLILLLIGGCGKSDGEDKGRTSTSALKSPPVEVSDPPAAAVPPDARVSLPRVIDLGRGKCIPCKRMAPILKELADVYQGRAIIEVIDIGEPGGREMASRYKVRMIPTQIFLDREGNEVWRHEGFLPREDIVQKLREMGVEEP